MAISRSINILLVDSNKTQITQTKEILSKTGFKNINYCYSGAEALEAIETSEQEDSQTKLIICSDEITDMGSVELYRNITGAVGRKIPFILLTGQSDQSMIIEAAKNGIKNILLRPFSHQALVNELAKILK